MSYVSAQPEMLEAAAGQVAGTGSGVVAKNKAVAAPTTGVMPAGADAVSVLTAAQFAAYGKQYQAISSQAEQILYQFVNTLRASAGSYASTEAANAIAAG